MSHITSISAVYNVALVNVGNLPNNLPLISEMFNSIAKNNINVDMISQSPPYRGSVNVSFSIGTDDLTKTISALNTFKKTIPDLFIEVDADNAKLTVFGEEMKDISGVAARLFTVLAGIGIELKMITTSEVDISFLICERDVDNTIEAVKKEYNLK